MSDTDASSEQAVEPDAEPKANEPEVVAVAAAGPWWRRWLPVPWRTWDRVTTWPRLASFAIAMTLIGSWVSWSSDGPVRLSGHEGSHDGWLATLAAVLALAAVGPLTRRSWPGIVVTLSCGSAVLLSTLADAPPPGSDLAWGWWLTFVGGLVMVTATIGTAVTRVVVEPDHRWVSSSFSWRHAVRGGLGIVGVIAVFLIYLQVLFVPERDSFPPSADAITASQAQAATERFVAGSPRPRDVDLEYAPSTAATVEPWPDGNQFFPRIFDDIRNARSSVHILMYGWTQGSVGDELATILRDKLAEGVEVRILVDGQGSDPDGASAAIYQGLVKAGAVVVSNDTIQLDFDGPLFDRRFDWRQDEFGRAEHRKLYVIDGVVAWTGGAGVEDNFNDGRFHDVMARVTGDVVRQAQAAFLTSFRAHGGPLPAELGRYFPPQPDPGTLPVLLAQVVPGGYVSASQATRELIDGAQHRVDIENPYLIDADIIQRLIAAAKRGVRVRVVVSQTSNNRYVDAAFSHHYRELIDAGAKVWEYPGAVTHDKVVVADDRVSFGTVNLDAWALYRDFEVTMIVQHPATVELFEARVFGPDIAHSAPAQPPTAVLDRAKAWFWDQLAYFL